MKPAITILLLCISRLVVANDSLKTLSEQQVFEIVKQFHPLAKQADINIEKAKADITSARGMFDPLLSAKLSNKTFGGIEYYNHFQPELKIPTWYGIEINAGLENLRGNRINPEETIGKTSYAGLTIPLAKKSPDGQTKSSIAAGKDFQTNGEVEKQTILNDLMLEAMNAYWQWVKQYEVMNVLANAVTVNEKRFELVKISYRQGVLGD